ncbi:MAG: potassium transporter Kup [Roseateles asaccharophilus]|uniref:Probable potassium transport system protein Kup n=1 Tax=Roseateles asaccharophilus TaxID=582607 RepID=A0A4R6NA93_9BURK|nr:potassium transporter Kup [Roseateles asaccharophilus]MDN3544988.1 potassium transporter Kup [Roseateles asaccharophilus]TDP12626.1 KUP system potassium uptake protein [Roseateles asaccharophilus]
MTLGALGVVYGDIGTSPLYALKEVFHGGHVPLSPDNILGVLSLLFWTMTIVVSLKYVLLILRADNNGEGGLIAMLALATQAVRDKPRLRRVLMLVGLFGTAIFFGDAVITPAMTVLGAVEGIDVYAPQYHDFIVPIAVLVLAGLFAVQRLGTAGVGKAFGPVMLVWFSSLALLGLPQVMANPEVLAAMNPAHALRFCLEYRWIAFVALGAVVLVVTGGEALYADLGHFGKRPIRIAWYGIVMPALVINYFGQGALLLKDPSAIKNPFYLIAPDWAEIPLFVLATLAAIVASQALITAAFSVTKQAIQLGILPRMRILHTSVRDTGQIYVPFVNWGLFVFVLLAVVLFGSSSKLAGAYGVAVTIDMTITTVMTFFVIRYGWRYPLPLCVVATGVFFIIDVTFLASNLLKLLHGGWFPLLIGIGMFTLMLTWKQGRRQLSQKLREDAIDLRSFLEAVFVSPPTRVAGTAVFLSAEQGVTPNALLHNLKHNKVLHEQNLFVSVKHHEVPWVGFEKRVEVQNLGNDCWQVSINFGFKNEPDVPEALKLLEQRGVQLEEMETSYFLSRDIVIPTMGGGMAPWREKLFASMHRNAAAAADFLHLPTNRIVELGAKVEI